MVGLGVSEGATLERTLREARNRLESLGAEGALVLLRTEGGELTVRKARGIVPEDVPARTGIFDAVLQSRAAILVLDARQDHRFQKLAGIGRSLLCAPIVDPAGEVLGLLYAESSQPGAFSHKNRADLQAFGKSLGAELPEAHAPEPAAAPVASEPGPWRAGLALPVGLLVLALLWPFVVGGLTSEPDARPLAPTATPLPEPDPAITVRSFLLLVQFEKLEEAYRLLDPALQARLSPEAFRSEVSSWLHQEGNSSDLAYRTPVNEHQDKGTAVVRVEASGGSAWTWHLTRVERDWLISECRGGPIR